MLFRHATFRDLTEIMRIIDAAVGRMLAEGKCQWSEEYPRDKHIIADIMAGNGYVLDDWGRIMAYGAAVFTGEPAYENIDGEWLTDGDYVVVHRMAVAQDVQSQGIGRKFLVAVEKYAANLGVGSFRIDTNFDNDRMLALLDKCSFEFTGLIHYPQGERRAFEKLI